MAIKKGKRGKGGDDVIIISKDDWKGKKDFPKAPSGKYRFRFNKKSSIKPNAAGNGSVINLISTITAKHNGKKTEHKGVNVFDNIAPHVGWKIAQILRAMGIKKAPRKMSLKELLNLIKKYDKEFRGIINVAMYKGDKKNNMTMYLPLKGGKDEDDDDIEDDEDSDDEDSDDDDDDSDDDDDEDDDDSDSDDDDEDDDSDDDDDDEDSDDDDDDDDEEDDDDDDPPRRKSKSKAKAKGKKRRK